MITHGLSKRGNRHPLYGVWRTIKLRCYNPNNTNYKYYGFLGVKVWSGWKDDFLNFYLWCIENGWEPGLEVDRYPNKNGDYSPWNCRIVTREENGNNKRNNLIFTIFGETKTLMQWIRDPRCVVCRSTFLTRIKLGWKPEDALTTKSNDGISSRRKQRNSSLFL